MCFVFVFFFLHNSFAKLFANFSRFLNSLMGESFVISSLVFFNLIYLFFPSQLSVSRIKKNKPKP